MFARSSFSAGRHAGAPLSREARLGMGSASRSVQGFVIDERTNGNPVNVLIDEEVLLAVRGPS